MVFTIGMMFAVMMLAAACTDSNKSDDSIFDYEKLDVDEYVYPSDFELGDDLRGAITELACCYHDFDETVIDGEDWKNIFLARFIQNSRYSFQYMDEQETKTMVLSHRNRWNIFNIRSRVRNWIFQIIWTKKLMYKIQQVA